MSHQTDTLPQPVRKRSWRRAPRTVDELSRCLTPVDRAFALLGGPEGLQAALAAIGVERHTGSIMRWRNAYNGFFPDDVLDDIRRACTEAGWSVTDAFLTQAGTMDAPERRRAS